MKYKTTLPAVVIGSALLMLGCSDGKDGESGQDGMPGAPGEQGSYGVHIDMANEANAVITSASFVDGSLSVDFSLENDQHIGLYGLSANNDSHDFRFSLAQLQTNDDSALKQWMSLLNEATNEAGTSFEQGFEQLKNCSECLIDHHDGTYTYTFETNLETFVDAAGVEFEPSLTQRIAIEMQFEYPDGHELAANAHYDWIPATDSIEGVDTRDLVTLETCYTCHQPSSLKAHGGRRLDLENCQSCHNGIVSDPKGVSVELGHMVHAIHMGPEREGKNLDGEVVAMPYTVEGYHGPHAFDYPSFPTKPFMDCTVCHVNDNTLADEDLWLSNANANACTGCHTSSPAEHKSDKNPKLACNDCHTSMLHLQYNKPYQAAINYDVSISNLSISDENTVTFDAKIVDASGNLVGHDEVYKKGYSKPYMVVSWDIDKDYPDYNQSPYSERRIDIKNATNATWNSDNTFTIKSKINFPSDINNKVVEILPLIKVCFSKGTESRVSCEDENAYPAYIQTATYKINLSENSLLFNARRNIIDEGKCNACHSYEFYHDSNGVNCMACHTNDKSLHVVEDKQGNAVAWGEMKSTSFMYKAHMAKGHDNGHGGSGTILKTDCTTCHSEDINNDSKLYGFELGRNIGKAHTIPSFIPDKSNDPSNTPVETWYASSDAGTCMSCHQKDLSPASIVHMESNGAYFGSDKNSAKGAIESCSTCHTSEKLLNAHQY